VAADDFSSRSAIFTRERTRVFAFVAAAFSVVAVVQLAQGVTFGDAAGWLIVPHLVFGAIIALRFYPFRITPRNLTDDNYYVWRSVAVDFGIAAAAEAVLLVVSFVLALVTQSDGAGWFLLLAILCPLFFLGFAGGIGLVVMALVLLPSATLAIALWRRLTGRDVDVVIATSALALLSIAGSAITGVLSLSRDFSVAGYRSRGLTDILIVLTGVRIPGEAFVEYQPLAWLARLLTVTAVLCLVVLARHNAMRRRSTRRRRKSG
jgi:hypothetical protein